MKRYDIGNSEQFGAKQFWISHCTPRYDVWVSYNTAVAIVDHETMQVYEGECARGFSRTTTNQVGQAYSMVRGYRGNAFCSAGYDYLMEKHPELTNCWGTRWDKYNQAQFAVYAVEKL